ncbi:MAG: hypothetical protein QOF92_1980 [Pseudonocardiales bacterium]|jgi:hypothetical protein|nr:hypothetical protein [Pseudonocardiales bacterium]
MRSRTGRRLVAGLLIAVAAVAFSGCTGSSKKKDTFKCAQVCAGTIHGAAYAIRMPKSWNGTLLVYSHGYRSDTGTGPGPAALTQTDRTGVGADQLTQDLLARGYALAGSSYASAGWAVDDALTAANELHQRFVQLIGPPKRVYAWGSSLGGLVTELLAERAAWVDGAVPMCGVVAGPLRTFDNALAALVATKALLAPQLQVSGWGNAASAAAQPQVATKAIQTAAADRTNGGAAKIVYLAERFGLPLKTQFFKGDSQVSLVSAAATSLAGYVTFALGILAQGEARFGGDAAQLPTTISALQLTPNALGAVTALNGNPSAYAATISSAAAVPSSSTARAELQASGDPTGRLRVPTVTMHTEFDPFAIIADEKVLADQVAGSGKAADLLQLFIAPPANYDTRTGPPYGINHCAFTDGQITGAITVLDQWVRTSNRPAAGEVAHDVGAGLDPTFTPPQWPT